MYVLRHFIISFKTKRMILYKFNPKGLKKTEILDKSELYLIWTDLLEAFHTFIPS